MNFSYVLFAEHEVEEIPTWLQEEINAESVVENLLNINEMNIAPPVICSYMQMTVCCEWHRDRDKVKIRGLHIGKIKKIKATKNPELDRRGFFGTEPNHKCF